MDSNVWLVVGLVAIWVGGGLWVALRMARAGHALKLTLPLGLVLGPFLAWFAETQPGSRPSPRPKPMPGDAGSLDVLIGLDGSSESGSAARSAVDLLRPSLGSLTLVTVLDVEDQGPWSGIPTQSAAYAGLVDVALQLDFEPTELELLYGAPAQTLADRAGSHGIDLIVIGARGHGLSDKLLGSVASELMERSPVPVMVGPSLSRSPVIRDGHIRSPA